jgi:hypothetical protein
VWSALTQASALSCRNADFLRPASRA